MSNELNLVKKENFNGIECDFYRDRDGVMWMTREQIGEALEYAEPRKAIGVIHDRNRERLDKFSLRHQIDTGAGTREVVLYSARGVYEICRWSNQPKANVFYDFVYDILEALRNGELKLISKELEEKTQNLIKESMAYVRKVEKKLAAIDNEKNRREYAAIINERIRETRLFIDHNSDYVPPSHKTAFSNFIKTHNEKEMPKEYDAEGREILDIDKMNARFLHMMPPIED